MKIDLQSIDKEQIMVHDSDIYGETLFLCQPQHIGCKWTQENKIFRSSLWNAQGELVSAGFPKFTNWQENSEHFPVPTSIKHCTAVEKIDGSLLIVSKYKGKLILRTRGTFDALTHDNGNELEIFKAKYSKFFDSLLETHDYSFLFEWVSPTNRIVLNYGVQPDWYLVGIVYHGDYSLVAQDALDIIAKNKWKRPTTYTFTSLEDLIEKVEQWKGKEGICLYSKYDQAIHKIKGTWYLDLHHLKSEISNTEKLVDVFINWEMPSYEMFEKKTIEIFDFELFSQVRGDISRICDAKKEADNIVEHMMTNIPTLRKLPRKDAALAIIGAYGQTAKKGIAFSLLDGRILGDREWKTLILQSLGK